MLNMPVAPKKPEEVKDEPGAEERFTRGIKKALDTQPKSHEDLKAERRANAFVNRGRKSKQQSQ